MPNDTQPVVTPAEMEADRVVILGRLASAVQRIDAGRADVESWSRWLPGDSGAVVTPLLDSLRATLTDGMTRIRAATDYDAMILAYRETIAAVLSAEGAALTGLAAQVSIPGFRFSRQAGLAIGEGVKALGSLAAEVAAGAGEGLGLGTIALIGVGLWLASKAMDNRPATREE